MRSFLYNSEPFQFVSATSIQTYSLQVIITKVDFTDPPLIGYYGLPGKTGV